MQTAKTLRQYKKNLRFALDDDFQRQALDKFAKAYPQGRKNAFGDMDIPGAIDAIVKIKESAAADMDGLYHQFKQNAEAAGARVYLAQTPEQANELIAKIARDNQVKKIVKSKSMTAEEIRLNDILETRGMEVTETDLGEWIIQLRHEGPSHMVLPAIHLSRNQVAHLFSGVTGRLQTTDIEKLVKVARRELRQKFLQADMGISGANFALAKTGTLGMVTNEGNARLVTTLPRIHVALVGLDKLLPSLHEALAILRVLPKNATGQVITSYVTWITGANSCGAAPDNKKQLHIVFLDNHRRELAKDPVFKEALRCVRCGACANVCPVYRMVGGHQYGHIYIGAIGLIITYFFHGEQKAKNLVQNCINCGACRQVCASGIDLPELIKAIRKKIQDKEGRPLPNRLMSAALQNRRLFHGLLKNARMVQAPLKDPDPLRHLPHIFTKDHDFKALPKLAKTPFRDLWPKIRPMVSAPRFTVALFSGCLQDFVYPEQLAAGVKLLAAAGGAVEFPMDQTCCGLPVDMVGETDVAKKVARQNLAAMFALNPDYVVTLCASCAAHIKNRYPALLGDSRTGRLAEKVLSFSQLVSRALGDETEIFRKNPDTKKTVTWHAPCHLCRGLNETEAPKDLMNAAGYTFAPAAEEETCCGFGGTWSVKFPEVSRAVLAAKLKDARTTGANLLLTECPGCVLQLRGGAAKQNLPIEVLHLAEALAVRMK